MELLNCSYSPRQSGVISDVMQNEKRSYVEDFQLEVEKEVAKIKGKLFYFLLVFFPICSGEKLFDTVGIKCGELIRKFSHSGK